MLSRLIVLEGQRKMAFETDKTSKRFGLAEKKPILFCPQLPEEQWPKDLGQDSIIICFNDFNPINVLKRGLED